MISVQEMQNKGAGPGISCIFLGGKLYGISERISDPAGILSD